MWGSSACTSSCCCHQASNSDLPCSPAVADSERVSSRQRACVGYEGMQETPCGRGLKATTRNLSKLAHARACKFEGRGMQRTKTVDRVSWQRLQLHAHCQRLHSCFSTLDAATQHPSTSHLPLSAAYAGVAAAAVPAPAPHRGSCRGWCSL